MQNSQYTIVMSRLLHVRIPSIADAARSTCPQVSAEERYKAVFRYGKYEYEVELPEVEDTGCTLRITQMTAWSIPG